MKNNNVKEFLLYLIVGGIATACEWAIFFVLDKVHLHYTLATIIAYVLSTFVNWFAGRILVFRENRQSVAKELLGIYIASIVGLLVNLVIMWVLVDLLTAPEMISKMTATAIVFFYNFLVRKLVIYKAK